MRDFLALRPLGGLLGLLVLALLAFAGARAAGLDDLLIPSAENTAEQFVSAMAAHRYSGALGQLSQDLEQQVSAADLQALMEAIEAGPHRGIQDAHAAGAQEDGQSATAAVRLKLGDNREQTLEFLLQKEHGLWRISSFDALRSLAG